MHEIGLDFGTKAFPFGTDPLILSEDHPVFITLSQIQWQTNEQLNGSMSVLTISNALLVLWLSLQRFPTIDLLQKNISHRQQIQN